MKPRKLPFRAQSAAGDVLDLNFPLHPDTGDVVRLSQLVSLILQVIDKDLGTSGEFSNGDVLQALSMALSIRAGMVYGSHEAVARLSTQPVQSALNAVGETDRRAPTIGHA